MKTAEIRRRFLDFFERNGHLVLPSTSLVYNDPTLLFVNAGMVPFKKYFVGEEDAPAPRIATCQKCVRTLDIEDVGKTTRHGTFFQMLGNFAFGDYFKEGAIRYAWELVTGPQSAGGLGFDPETVWVTVLGPGFHADYPEGDVEARRLWRAMGVPDERIQGRSLKDNYWNMGVPGPGGPCSEIYIDRGPEFGLDGGPVVDEDRFLEIWNLVFQQEDLSAVRAKDDFDIRAQLPSRNIDTGAGLERIAYLLQGKRNMYEIDEIFPVIERAAELAGTRYGADPDADVRLRVVGDHIRSALMLMTDGVAPGNEARGYVLRRLLRRSIRSMRLLGVTDRVLPELLPISRDLMQESYPEILTQWARVSANAYAEEEAFRRTLAAGTQIFEAAASRARAAGESGLAGDQAFQLHDTYGFPIDLTLEMAAEQGLEVDREGFRRLMQEQKDRAKADARAKKGGGVDTAAFTDLRRSGETPFRGYHDLQLEARVRGLVADGRPVASAKPGDVVEVVLEETPFYAESGGQDADSGVLTANGVHLDVLDVQKPVDGLITHKVAVVEGEITAGDLLLASVDAAARKSGAQAHSATHIVHAVLRRIVGPTAVQAGSYNRPGYLRFDYSAPQGLTADMRAELEGLSNDAIDAAYEVTTQHLPLTEARALGAMAMFGEKYPDVVRVIEMGGPFSRELCGGTHVTNSAQIGMLTLLGESSIGSGVRRVEALVSRDAFAHLARERALVSTLSDLLKTQPAQLEERVAAMVAQLKAAEKEVADLRARELLGNADALVASAVAAGPHRLVAQQVPGVAGNDLRTLALDLRTRLGSDAAVVALVGGTDAKPAVIVVTNEAARAAGAKAGRLVAVAAERLGGRGGGKDDIAQGGGSNAAGAADALRAVREELASA